MQYSCLSCGKNDHCNGTKSVSVFDTEDGPNWYSCKCSCAVRARRQKDEDRKIRDFIKKYGQERIRSFFD